MIEQYINTDRIDDATIYRDDEGYLYVQSGDTIRRIDVFNKTVEIVPDNDVSELEDEIERVPTADARSSLNRPVD